jgi:hypothetical protein
VFRLVIPVLNDISFWLVVSANITFKVNHSMIPYAYSGAVMHNLHISTTRLIWFSVIQKQKLKGGVVVPFATPIQKVVPVPVSKTSLVQ